MKLRVTDDEFRALPLEAHQILTDVPLRDVSAIDLPGGGEGRTIADVRALLSERSRDFGGALANLLFALRLRVGRLLGWDDARHDPPGASYLPRVPPPVRARSTITPGTADGAFRTLYALDRESLSEIRNATVHAFLSAAILQRPSGYRVYWGIYVKPTSGWTSIYMAIIEPFRRFIVYPALFRRLLRAWRAHYPSP